MKECVLSPSSSPMPISALLANLGSILYSGTWSGAALKSRKSKTKMWVNLAHCTGEHVVEPLIPSKNNTIDAICRCRTCCFVCFPGLNGKWYWENGASEEPLQLVSTHPWVPVSHSNFSQPSSTLPWAPNSPCGLTAVSSGIGERAHFFSLAIWHCN